MSSSFVSALLGGALIGLSAALLLLLNGRVAGVSGILGGALRPRAYDFVWRLMFLAGLVLTGVAMARLWPGRFDFSAAPRLSLLGLSGLLVGLGTRLGSGCTSGHGVCGIGMGSRRSMLATVTFMAAAILTVFVVRHVS